MIDAAKEFELHRRHLAGLAYRMLGSVAESEDVLQDAFLRWSAAQPGASAEAEGEGDAEVDADASAPRPPSIASPRAYLSRVVTRLCLDRLKSARARREQYVGTWLPEPLVSSGDDAGSERAEATGRGPLAEAEAGGDQVEALALAEDLSIALLVTLETLSPLERAAFLLHDVFDMDFSEIAGVLERSEPAVRQLAARARTHVRDGRPRFSPSPSANRLAEAFHGAVLRGELPELARMLAEDAVFYSDGGGKRRAALNPIFGREKILRFFVGIARKRGSLPDASEIQAVLINGMPGFLVHGSEGIETMALEIVGEQITAIYAVRNPDKLRHLS